MLEEVKEHVTLCMSLWDTMSASTLRRHDTIDTYRYSIGNGMQ